jgi:invasion protein IalB
MRVVEKDKQVVVLAWLIGRDQQGVLKSVLQTPTGVQIAKGVELKLANKTVTVPYVNCEAQRCESSIEMGDEVQREAEAADTVTATITTSDGRGISFNFAIKGIDKVLAAMAATR